MNITWGHYLKWWSMKFYGSLPQLKQPITGKNDQNQLFQNSGTWLDTTTSRVLDKRRVLVLCKEQHAQTSNGHPLLRPTAARRCPVFQMSGSSRDTLLKKFGRGAGSQLSQASESSPAGIYWKFKGIGILFPLFLSPFGAKYLRKSLSGHCLITDNGIEISVTTHKKEYTLCKNSIWKSYKWILQL